MVFFQIISSSCVGAFFSILPFQLVCIESGPFDHHERSFLVQVQFPRHMANCLRYPKYQITNLELPSFNSPVIILSYLLLIYAKFQFGIGFDFFYQVEVGPEVLWVLLFIEDLCSQAQDFDFNRGYFISAKGEHEVGFSSWVSTYYVIGPEQPQNVICLCSLNLV